MGNSITYELQEEDDIDDDPDAHLTVTLNPESEIRDQISSALETMVGHIMGALVRPTTEMPVVRKKPDLQVFRYTMLYKEIKALCGLPANSKRPSERWSLMRGLMKRENGIVAGSAGTFTPNQHRRIVNLFVPNKKEERLMSLEAKVFICKFNKDGSKLITACQDSIIRVFDSSKGTYHRVNRLKADDVTWSILDIDFSPCGQYFAYSTWSDFCFTAPIDGTTEDIQWVRVNTSQHRTGVFSLRFSPCGNTLIGAGNNSNVFIYDRKTGSVKKIRTQLKFEDVNAISYVTDKDPNVFVSGCNNGYLKLWDIRCLDNSRSRAVGEFVGHLDGITYIDPRNDGNYVLTNSKDQSIKIWDLRKTTPSNKTNRTLPYFDWDYRWDAVPREYYNPTITLDGDVSIMTYRGHRVTKSLLRAKFSPATQTGQRYIYTGCGTGRIIIYDVLTGLIKEAIEGHKDIVRDLSWHPTRAEIVSGSWDSHVNLNTFKRNPLLKRASTERMHGPLRRSRRIANQNGELIDDDEESGFL